MRIIRYFQVGIIYVLLLLMMATIIIATVELGFIFVEQVLKPPALLLSRKALLEIFGFFLMIVVGLELVESIKVSLEENIIHVEVILLVALVAVSRKIIILDYKEVTPQMLFGISSVVIGVSVGYYVVKAAARNRNILRTDIKAVEQG